MENKIRLHQFYVSLKKGSYGDPEELHKSLDCTVEGQGQSLTHHCVSSTQHRTGSITDMKCSMRKNFRTKL